MLEKKRFHIFATGLAVAAVLTFGATSLRAQSMTAQPTPSPSKAEQHETPSITPSATDTDANPWTDAQLIPLTVSQAWRMSGRNEDKFFDIVQQLAVVSARNRGLTLPNTAAAGQKAGAYIKRAAKADHQQLLYEIVDKAVREVGTPEAEPTSAN